MFLQGDEMKEKVLTETGLEAVLSLLALPILIGPGIVVWQVFNWLQTAKWKPIAVSDTLTYFEIPLPRLQWLGLQKIADMVLDWPLSVVVFVLWIALIVFTIAIIEERSKRKIDKQFGR
jgi:hypothetical protein